jgi:outer membrane lipoprotein LolB
LPNYYFGHILFLMPSENKGYRVHYTKRFLAVSTIVWIVANTSGCTTITPPAPAQSTVTWESRQALLAQLHNWKVTGKIAVITAKDSGSANVDWAQHGQNFTLSLYGPLGANAISMNGTPGHVTLKTNDGKIITAPTAEQLLADQWGWKLPLSYLQYWVRGLPVPNLPQKSTYDAAHRLATLSQQGFTIQYQGYTTAGALELPQHLSITSTAFKTKIVIYKWNI